MKKLLFILSFIILPLCSNSLQAQNSGRRPQSGPGIISGFVLDSSAKQALSYATISILDPKDSTVLSGAVSKDSGNFVVDHLPIGTYLVKISFIGYNKLFIKNVPITKEKPIINLDTLYLTPSEHSTEEVNVVAKKDIVTYKIDKKVVNIDQIPNAKGQPVIEALKQTPAVNVDMDGNLTIKGSKSYQVLIDGKPSSMSGSDILKQLPADMVESIEIITNPSAKYDPEGTGGILNIILKKGQKNSLISGLASVSAGTKDKYSASTNLNYRNDKFSVNGGVSYNKYNYLQTSDFTNENMLADSTQFVRSMMDRKMISENLRGNLSGDYSLSETNSLSCEFDLGNYTFERRFPTKYKSWVVETTPSYSYNEDKYKMDGNYFSGNLTHIIKFEPESNDLTTTFSYGYMNGSTPNITSNFLADSNFNKIGSALKTSRTNNDATKYSYKLTSDYKAPIFDSSRVEAGVSIDFKNNKYNFLAENYISNLWTKDASISNDYKFKQEIYAAYATFGTTVFGLDALFGLRYEYCNRTLKQLTTNTDYDYTHSNFYPSLHLSKYFSETDQVQLSYSRRVERPDDRLLNPFQDYSDAFYISKGNPNLASQLTNSVELSYIKTIDKSSIQSEVFFTQTDNKLEQTQTLLPSGKTLLSFGNTSKEFTVGGSINSNIVLSERLRFYCVLNTFRQSYKETAGADERNKMIYYGYISASINLTENLYFQPMYYYYSPSLISNGTMKQIQSFGFSVKQDLMNKKLSISLSGQDVFGLTDYKFNNAGLNYRSNGTFTSEHSVFYLSLSYMINDYRSQPKKSENVEMDYNANSRGR